MIATRFAGPVAVVLGLAIVPTVIHSYIGVTIDDGRRAAQVVPELEGWTSRETARRPDWVQRRFETEDFVERVYETEPRGAVRLFVARSYDAKRLYHHPELAVAYGTLLQSEGIRRVDERPDVPVHVLSGGRGGALALYVLHYDRRFVESAYVAQARAMLRSLWTGRLPMTILFAIDDDGGSDSPDASPAWHVLIAAVRAFERQGATASDRASGRAAQDRHEDSDERLD